MALRAGQAVAALAYLVLPHLRRHAEINLRLAFPDLDEPERAQIKRGAFRNLGRLLGEISQFPRLNRENISSIVVYEGLENYHNAVARGRGWETVFFPSEELAAVSGVPNPSEVVARCVGTPGVAEPEQEVPVREGTINRVFFSGQQSGHGLRKRNRVLILR